MDKGLKESLKKAIRVKQEELNKLLEKDNADRDKVLNISMDLDKLITKYHSLNEI